MRNMLTSCVAATVLAAAASSLAPEEAVAGPVGLSSQSQVSLTNKTENVAWICRRSGRVGHYGLHYGWHRHGYYGYAHRPVVVVKRYYGFAHPAYYGSAGCAGATYGYYGAAAPSYGYYGAAAPSYGYYGSACPGAGYYGAAYPSYGYYGSACPGAGYYGWGGGLGAGIGTALTAPFGLFGAATGGCW